MQLSNLLQELICLWPARLTVEKAAGLLGFQVHDIPVLIKAGMLQPLGKPKPNAPKYFAACEIAKLAGDVKWLDKASKVINAYWVKKNARRKNSPGEESASVPAVPADASN